VSFLGKIYSHSAVVVLDVCKFPTDVDVNFSVHFIHFMVTSSLYSYLVFLCVNFVAVHRHP